MAMTKKAKTGELDNVAALQKQATSKFTTLFAHAPTLVAFAPGRVNLIGEHTDYSEGFVFPMAIELGVACAASKSATPGVVRAFSLQKHSDGIVEFKAGEHVVNASSRQWAVFLSGVAAMHLKRVGGKMDFGVDCVFASDVPLGGGLSSSAALDVAFCLALEQLADPAAAWSGIERALVCVDGDHAFAKVPCGIMDQFISSNAIAGAALLIDCRASTFETIPLKDPSLTIVVANTNVVHSHSTSSSSSGDGGAAGEYKQRVEQCQAACRMLGVRFLRDIVDVAAVETLADSGVRRRARHVGTENARCLHAAQAAREDDWREFGRLMKESHVSLRDDYEVSCAELDVLVGIAEKAEGVYGARMTGGGFGGCIVALVDGEANARALVAAVLKEYPERAVGKQATCHVFRGASAGCRVLSPTS